MAGIIVCHLFVPCGDTVELTSLLQQIGILVIIAISAAIVIYITMKANRARKDSPDYIPGDGIAAKLRRWTGRESTRGEYSTQLQPTESAPSLVRVRRDGGASRDRSREPSRDRSRDIEMGLEANRDSTVSGAGVDRNTSVRSVMTLPAYSPAARDTEQILGREGERGGIDVVLEYPENADEEETRREEEMESLYQIRRARRDEQAEREERRRQRREARSRGDFETLRRLQEESRQRAQDDTLVSQQLIAEHQNTDRRRRVSSVQYAELGVARHDGSRIRANSTESDNRPLLDSAASISGASTRPSALTSMHTRGRSASSVLSISTTASDEMFNPSVHRNNSGEAEDYEVISLDNRSRTSSIGRRTPTPGIPEEGDESTAAEAGRPSGDLGEQHIPIEEPPRYIEGDGWGEEAPPYESPIATRAPILPIPRALQQGGLPSIEIQVASPVSRSNSMSPARSPARSIDEAVHETGEQWR